MLNKMMEGKGMDDIQDKPKEQEPEKEASVNESQIVKALDSIFELSESEEFQQKAPCPHFIAGVQTAIVAVGLALAAEMGASKEQIESVIGSVKAASAVRRNRATGKKLN